MHGGRRFLPKTDCIHFCRHNFPYPLHFSKLAPPSEAGFHPSEGFNVFLLLFHFSILRVEEAKKRKAPLWRIMTEFMIKEGGLAGGGFLLCITMDTTIFWFLSSIAELSD